MTGKRRLAAFLDASALYPALLRNILMRMAVDDLYRAFWTERVQDEWTQAIFRDRPDLPRAQIERTRRLMDKAVDDATVVGYEPLIETLTLPDADDRHVLAAAIHCGASIIVTANLRDFPHEILARYGLEALHPDGFILELFRASPDEVVGALLRLRRALKNPPMTPALLLAAMSRQGLNASAEALGEFADAL